jgi:hypothetical protein
MTALDDKITALEVKINGYETQLNVDGISEEKWNRLSGLITSGRETLNRLLDERKAQSAGKFICGSI